MITVVSNTSPLMYLITIGEHDILRQLFAHILIPQAVCNELCASGAPHRVREVMSTPPSWIMVMATTITIEDAGFLLLDRGEQEAICLAEHEHADLLLIDDKRGRHFAQSRKIPVVGKLGVLDRASQCGLIRLSHSLEKLHATNFRIARSILDRFLHQ